MCYSWIKVFVNLKAFALFWYRNVGMKSLNQMFTVMFSFPEGKNIKRSLRISHRPWLLLLLSLQSCPTLCNPIDSSLPGSSIIGFSRQKYWSGLPFPSPHRPGGIYHFPGQSYMFRNLTFVSKMTIDFSLKGNLFTKS